MFNKPIRTKGRNTFIRGSISEYAFQGIEIDIAADDIEIRDCIFYNCRIFNHLCKRIKFINCHFANCVFKSAYFYDCFFSGYCLDCDFYQAEFKFCQLDFDGIKPSESLNDALLLKCTRKGENI